MPSVLLNGRLVGARRAMIPALDRAVMPGLGLFETLRLYDGRPFRLREHLRRLRDGARRLGLRCPWRDAQIERDIDRLVWTNGALSSMLRIVLTAGAPGIAPSLLVVTASLPPVPLDSWTRGVVLDVAPFVRDPRSPLAGLKTLSYLEGRLTRTAARERGSFEAVYVSPDGRLLEGTSTNLFAVFGKTVVTPPLSGILPGVTRALIGELTPVRERPVRLKDIGRADEIFLTNALIEVLPVGRAGSIRLPRSGFPVARRIQKLYAAATASPREATRRSARTSE